MNKYVISFQCKKKFYEGIDELIDIIGLKNEKGISVIEEGDGCKWIYVTILTSEISKHQFQLIIGKLINRYSCKRRINFIKVN